MRILIPMAYRRMEDTEHYDSASLTEITKDLDNRTRGFFEAICMLAFADSPEHGEFMRTIIRANPLRGVQVSLVIQKQEDMITFQRSWLIIFKQLSKICIKRVRHYITDTLYNTILHHHLR